ncbi:unnamed protein product [Meloidogyne enterolobii]|uniref:Uncharacterized protein n=2 Tax=Meloidogyne enterolobii TaxID=390850 RepID=A0ACB0YKA2_MELEN|nr:unnamed protein product [Meloidogyne enterolobii]
MQHRNSLYPIELWNLCHRLQDGLSRSNNSVESWHNIWGSLLERKPLFSKFVKRMLKEFARWEHIVADYNNSPGNGIRGKGIKRKTVYLNQDRNLQQIFADFAQRANDPLRYLRSISYHLAQ